MCAGRGRRVLSLRDRERKEKRDFGGESGLTFSTEVPTESGGRWEDALLWI